MHAISYIGPGIGPEPIGPFQILLLALGVALIGLLVLGAVSQIVYRCLRALQYRPVVAFAIGCLAHVLMLSALYAWAVEGPGALYVVIGASLATLLVSLAAAFVLRVAAAAYCVMLDEEVDWGRLLRAVLLILGVPLLLSIGVAEYDWGVTAVSIPILIFVVLALVAFVAYGLDELLRMDEESRGCPVRVPVEGTR